jgi:hypothetical protein
MVVLALAVEALMAGPLIEFRVLMECAECGHRSIWRSNNRVIYPDHTLYCGAQGAYTWHRRIKRGRPITER